MRKHYPVTLMTIGLWRIKEWQNKLSKVLDLYVCDQDVTLLWKSVT